MVTDIRDPPSFVGQFIRQVLVVYSGPCNATIAVRGLTCTIPSDTMDKEAPGMFARRAFHLVRADSEDVDPDEVRAGRVGGSLRISG